MHRSACFCEQEDAVITLVKHNFHVAETCQHGKLQHNMGSAATFQMSLKSAACSILETVNVCG
jgi:hypothetical protein